MPNPTDRDYYIEVGETTLPKHRQEIEMARAAMVLPIPLSAKEPHFKLQLGGRQGSRPGYHTPDTSWQGTLRCFYGGGRVRWRAGEDVPGGRQ